MKTLFAFFMACAILVFAPVAQAQETVFDEARLGGTWAQPDWLDKNHLERDQAGLNAQILFKPVNIDLFNLFEGEESLFLNELITPRPTIGGMVNFHQNGTSYVHAGLVWHFALSEVFFLEAGFGGGWNDGANAPTATRVGIGSKWLFNESIALGMNVTEHTTVLVQIDHLSHASLASSSNRGLTNISARVGYKY